jgi:DHA1 family bicyclomycin/chloramphenicol resistance-like MFS transporter
VTTTRITTPAGGRGLVITLGGLSMFGPLSSDMYLPGLPSLTRSLHESASAGQLTLTASVLGLGFGQVLLGAVSDARGRRLPLLLGLIGFSVSSLLCAVAPSIWLLIALRFLQGICGAAGIVIARAIVRDSYSGDAAARTFALVFTINSVAPILAPLLGGQILRFSSWRGVFVALAVIGGLLLVATLRLVPESLAQEDRHRGGLVQTGRIFRSLLLEPRFTAPSMAFALSFCAMFAYISGGSFVLENIYHVSPQVFSAVFAVNAVGLIVLTLLSGRLVGAVGLRTLLRCGLLWSIAGAGLTLVACLAHANIWLLLLGLFAVTSAQGLVMPNAVTIAMSARPDAHGSASGLIGLGQFGMGAIIAPLVGLGGSHDAAPMGIVIAASATAALAIGLTLTRPRSAA